MNITLIQFSQEVTEIEKYKERSQTLQIENEYLKCKLKEVDDLMKAKDSEITAAAKEITKFKQEIHTLANHDKDLGNAQKTCVISVIKMWKDI